MMAQANELNSYEDLLHAKQIWFFKNLTLVFIVWANVNNISKANSNFCILKDLTGGKEALLSFKNLQEIL